MAVTDSDKAAESEPGALQKKQSNLVTVGEIAGAHGIKGWVKVKSFTQPAANITGYSPWWLQTKHGVKAVETDESRERPQGVVAHIIGVDDRDTAAALYGTKIAVERDQMPALSDGEYYWHELIGLVVTTNYSGTEQRLGTVESLLETGANDVLVVKADASSIDDRERLIPYLPGSAVVSVDIDQGVMQVDWDPEF